MPEEAKIEGVALTSVTVNAASPDVIGSLMKRVTEEVMKLIPEGALEKIAQEVIRDGGVLRYEREYGRQEVKRVALSNLASDACAKLIEREISRQVELYLAEATVKQVVANGIKEGISHALVNLPFIAAKQFGERLGHFMVGALDPTTSPESYVQSIDASLKKTQLALQGRGLINHHEV